MHASWVSTWGRGCELQMEIQTTTAVLFLPETLSTQGNTFKFWEWAYEHCSGELKREEWQQCVSHLPIISSQDRDKIFTFLQIQLRRLYVSSLNSVLKGKHSQIPNIYELKKKVKILDKSHKYDLKELLSMSKCIKTLTLRGVYYFDQVIFPLPLQRKSLNTSTLC